MKAHATERMRQAVNDAMDIHGGKGVMDGPLNYLGDLYRAIPVSITVEGANILTRNLMIFGQGAIRCHPHLLAEMQALADPDREKALEDFDKAFWAHVLGSLKTVGRAFWRSWTCGHLAPHPGVGVADRHYRQLSRYASVLAFLSDVSLLTLGGALKRKEMLSARLGDILSELYLLSAVLKRFEDEGRVEADGVLVDYCMATGLKTIEISIDGIIANFPSRPMAWLLRAVVPRDAKRHSGPADALILRCAKLITEPSETRARLTSGLYLEEARGGGILVERAFRLVHETEPVRDRLHQARIRDWHAARASGLLTAAEAAALQEAEDAVHQAILVDDFAPEELEAPPRQGGTQLISTDPRRSAGRPVYIVNGARPSLPEGARQEGGLSSVRGLARDAGHATRVGPRLGHLRLQKATRVRVACARPDISPGTAALIVLTSVAAELGRRALLEDEIEVVGARALDVLFHGRLRHRRRRERERGHEQHGNEHVPSHKGPRVDRSNA